MRDWLSNITKQHGTALAIAGCYVAVAGLSLVPEVYRPRVPGFSDTIEHLVAYLVLGMATATVMRPSIQGPVLIMAIVAFAGILEIGQKLVPCRDASLLDFGAGALGAAIGVSISRLVRAPQA